MSGIHKLDKTFISAEQQINVTKGRRVIPMSGTCWEKRREVDDIRTKIVEVIEASSNSRQITAKVFVRSVLRTTFWVLIPLPRHSPLR